VVSNKKCEEQKGLFTPVRVDYSFNSFHPGYTGGYSNLSPSGFYSLEINEIVLPGGHKFE